MELFEPVHPTVLVVENSPVETARMVDVLRSAYRVQTASSLALALQRCHTEPPDLVLADVTVPNPDGHQLQRQLSADIRTNKIPVIFLSRRTDSVNDNYAIDWGAVTYLTRPIQPHLLLARVRKHFLEHARLDALYVSNEYLEEAMARELRQIDVMQNVTILALAALTEMRDVDTGNHLRRTQNYMLALASYLARHPRFAAELSGSRVQTLFKCAPLHDIGKVGIPDRILLKHGRYTQEEYKLMKAHPRLGRDALESMQFVANQHVDFLVVAKEIVYSHHERWDGSGYPQGLVGEAIPVSARLMALADVYDALISRRIYKEGMSHEQACALIEEGKGTHFDPDVVDAFLALRDVFKRIAKRYADSDEDLQRKVTFQSLATGHAVSKLRDTVLAADGEDLPTPA